MGGAKQPDGTNVLHVLKETSQLSRRADGVGVGRGGRREVGSGCRQSLKWQEFQLAVLNPKRPSPTATAVPHLTPNMDLPQLTKEHKHHGPDARLGVAIAHCRCGLGLSGAGVWIEGAGHKHQRQKACAKGRWRGGPSCPWLQDLGREAAGSGEQERGNNTSRLAGCDAEPTQYKEGDSVGRVQEAGARVQVGLVQGIARGSGLAPWRHCPQTCQARSGAACRRAVAVRRCGRTKRGVRSGRRRHHIAPVQGTRKSA